MVMRKEYGFTNAVKNPHIAEASMDLTEKKLELFHRQKVLLATFLSIGAISQAQHDKSLNCLIEKMGIQG